MKFSSIMIEKARKYWHEATNHPFIREMVEGSLDKNLFAEYLIQDYAFVDSFLDLIGYTIAYSNTIEQKHKLSTFLSMITSEEDDYFLRSFKALGVAEERYNPKKVKRFSSIEGFDREIREAIKSGKYENCLAVLACAESVYCEWAKKYRKWKNSNYF